MPGSGTTALPPGLPSPANAPAVPLVNVTFAPAPMVSDASLWLTEPKRVSAFATTTAEPNVLPKAPLILVVPALVVSEL